MLRTSSCDKLHVECWLVDLWESELGEGVCSLPHIRIDVEFDALRYNVRCAPQRLMAFAEVRQDEDDKRGEISPPV